MKKNKTSRIKQKPVIRREWGRAKRMEYRGVEGRRNK